MLSELLALSGLLIGTATDMDHREVPDWVNYTMVFAGVLIAAILSAAIISWQPLIASLTGLALGYLLGAAMYYTGQWGGGDAKMLMGLGALLGVPTSFLVGASTTPLFIYFLIAAVFAGAAYGMIWMAVLFITKRAIAWPALKKKLRTQQTLKIRKLAASTLLILALITLIYTHVYTLLILVLAAISYLTFYLSLAAKTIEETCFVKKQPVKDLVVGDWILKDVKKNNQTIIKADNTGLTEKQLAKLKKHDIKTVTIKEGIPFVPSFLAAYLAAYWWWSSELGLLFWI